MAPRQGKWWNESSHEWVYTDLTKVTVPDNDDDLLHALESELDAAGAPTGASAGAVKDTYYYDMLEVRRKTERTNKAEGFFETSILLTLTC
jgi:hypothetical protein